MRREDLGRPCPALQPALGGTLRHRCWGAQLWKRCGRWEPLLHVSGRWRARPGAEKQTHEPPQDRQTNRQTPPPPRAFLMLSTRGRCFQASLKASGQRGRSTLSPTVRGWGPGRGAPRECGGARGGPRIFTSPFLPLHQGPEQPQPTVRPAFSRLRGQLGLWVRRCQAGPLSSLPPTATPTAGWGRQP